MAGPLRRHRAEPATDYIGTACASFTKHTPSACGGLHATLKRNYQLMSRKMRLNLIGILPCADFAENALCATCAVVLHELNDLPFKATPEGYP